MECRDAARCYHCSMVCVSLLDITVSCAELAELIDVSFGVWTRVGSRNHVLGGGLDPPSGRGNFGGAPCDAAFGQNSLTVCFISNHGTY